MTDFAQQAGEGPGYRPRAAMTFDKIIVKMGWQQAEGVPCLCYFHGADGNASMLTKTDDILISEDKESCKSITDSTFKAFAKANLDVKRTDDVISVDGMAIERDRSKRELKVSMPQLQIDKYQHQYESPQLYCQIFLLKAQNNNLQSIEIEKMVILQVYIFW